MKCITDDIAFARKRLVNRNTIYSGLFDILHFDTVQDLGNTTELSVTFSSAFVDECLTSSTYHDMMFLSSTYSAQ